MDTVNNTGADNRKICWRGALKTAADFRRLNRNCEEQQEICRRNIFKQYVACRFCRHHLGDDGKRGGKKPLLLGPVSFALTGFIAEQTIKPYHTDMAGRTFCI